MAIIYKITNPKKEIYIGTTITKLWKRKSLHRMERGKSLINSSFHKYGFNNHIFDEVCNVNDEDRFELEHFMIQEFETELNQVKEYNNTAQYKIWVNDGIKEFQIYPDNFKEFINIKKGRIYDIRSLGKSNIGRKHSKESVANRSKPNMKVVHQYKDDVFIRSFESAAEAGKVLNLCSSTISKNCKGIRKVTGGYKFYYEKKEKN